MPVHHSLISQDSQSTVSRYCLISVSVSACSADWNVITVTVCLSLRVADGTVKERWYAFSPVRLTSSLLFSLLSSSSFLCCSLSFASLLMLQQCDSNLGIRWLPPWEPPGTLWHHSTSAAPESYLTHPGNGYDWCYRVRFIPGAYGRYGTSGFLAVVQWRYLHIISICPLLKLVS